VQRLLEKCDQLNLITQFLLNFISTYLFMYVKTKCNANYEIFMLNTIFISFVHDMTRLPSTSPTPPTLRVGGVGEVVLLLHKKFV